MVVVSSRREGRSYRGLSVATTTGGFDYKQIAHGHLYLPFGIQLGFLAIAVDYIIESNITRFPPGDTVGGTFL